MYLGTSYIVFERVHVDRSVEVVLGLVTDRKQKGQLMFTESKSFNPFVALSCDGKVYLLIWLRLRSF